MKETRKEALLANELHYFSGKECKRGHIAIRRASNGNCTKCEEENNNSSQRKQYMSEYADSNRSRIRQIASTYQKNNKGKVNARTASRHAAKMCRTPNWLTKEEKTRIQCYYQVAMMRSKETGYSWHVDHIVPLQGECVSGLHVPWNLRVIQATDNIRKKNTFYG